MTGISAHQGGSETARPATYEAYEHVLTAGADCAEFDVRKTKDDVLVVHHDARAGNTGLPVSALGYHEMCDRLGYSVPKAGDVMEMLAGKMTGHLDLKEAGYERDVVGLALSIFGHESFVASTWADESVATIKRAFPQVRTALTLGRDLEGVPRHRWPGVRLSEMFPLTRVRACGAGSVAVNHILARLGVTRACARNGIGVMVWTVDSDALIDHFVADQRVDVLITNRPRRAVQRRAALTGSQAGPAAA